MTNKNIAILSGCAVLSLGMSSNLAQERPFYSQGKTIVSSDKVADANRASRVIGMQVENDRNQNLGRIEDVVFDFQNGRIGYVVLAVPTLQGEKLIPVPAEELSPGNNRFVLMVDRAALERAPGFARTSWPDLHRPFAGWEGLWSDRERWVLRDMDHRRPGRFEPARSEREFDQDQFDTDRREVYRLDESRWDRSQWDRDRYDQGSAPVYERSTRVEEYRLHDDQLSNRDTFRGQIVAINPEARTLSVESKNGEVRDFVIAERPTLQLKENRYPRLTDLKVGFPVSVGFREGTDRSVAHTIIRTDAPEVR